jgi:hypothetical protein
MLKGTIEWDIEVLLPVGMVGVKKIVGEERSLAMLNSDDITTKPFEPPVKK